MVRDKLFIIWVILIYIFIELAIFFKTLNNPLHFTAPDSRDYITLADNVIELGKYVNNSRQSTRIILSPERLNIVNSSQTEAKAYPLEDNKAKVTVRDVKAGNLLLQQNTDFRSKYEYEIFRAPGYPLFIAGIRYLLGYHKPANEYKTNLIYFNTKSITERDLVMVIICQIALNTLILFLIRKLSLLIFENNYLVCRIAVFFQMLSLPSIVYANKVLSETLFTFLLLSMLLFIEFSIKYGKKGILKKSCFISLAAGIIGGVATLTRVILLPFFPILISYFYIRLIKKRKSLIILSFSVPYILIVGAWGIRNYYTTGYPGVSSVGSINVYRYYACALLAKQKGISFAEQQHLCDENLNFCKSQPEAAKYAMKYGLPVILKSPFSYAVLHLKSDINSLLPAVGELYKLFGFKIGGKGTLSVINTEGLISGIKHYFKGHWVLFWYALPLILLLALKYFCVVYGIISYMQAIIFLKDSERFFPYLSLKSPCIFYIMLIGYMLVVPGPVSHPRFRVPVEPLISILAAYGLTAILRHRKIRMEKPKKGENLCI